MGKMLRVTFSLVGAYVACLAAYNNGYLHGVWIDADREFQKARRSAR